jgi:hypothetical protein
MTTMLVLLRRALLSLVLLSPNLFAQGSAAKLILVEDFETTTVGEIPKEFTKTGAVAVVDDTAHSGKHALRMEAAERGPRRITKAGLEIAALGDFHWGRLYFKVKLPTPAPVIPEGKKVRRHPLDARQRQSDEPTAQRFDRGAPG